MIKRQLRNTGFLLLSVFLLTGCIFEDIFGDYNLPPTTLTSNIYPALNRYIGMSEERVAREMSKISGAVVSKQGYNLIVNKQGDFGYVFTIRREVDAVVFNKYYHDRQLAVNDLALCSRALHQLGSSGSEYLGKFNNRDFFVPGMFTDYLNNNKNRYPSFVASEFRMALIGSSYIPVDWTTSISAYGSDISVMVGYIE